MTQHIQGPRLPYRELQASRQQNILNILENGSATTERLVQLYDLARTGLHRAVSDEAGEGDAITFMNLQMDIREQLALRPTAELLAISGIRNATQAA